MKVRKARMEDLEEVLLIYSIARNFMIANNNPQQWRNNHPKKELLVDDIKKGQLYVVGDEKNIYGVFALIFGMDETYNYIEGNWLNDNDYAAIHRIASRGSKKGIFDFAISYCKRQISDLRIDTHEDNLLMQRLITKNNFQYCGIIYVEDGSARLAYHYSD
ncbi:MULTISPECIES: GNAT family N-acetyltransferase [unclassified Gemella]|uniref:GNAT family N-acetyltransferase n=1 Tax=unclassified Gemella TaxID=2624949 RepID=UPI001C043A59|nr:MULTISPECIES: GNAT family N-acetyltransferase [unclassified Gemella]MBU0278574.1 GNAT family N-acetyltransferase [Gemella sp. zg-1178]QWQ38300.1 GNAT family N-acetyltransferase [Gemella sp. zg-570]